MENNNLNTETQKKVVEEPHKNAIFTPKVWKSIFIIALVFVMGIGFWFYKNITLINSYADKVYPGASILNKDLTGFNNNDLHNTLVSLFNDISNKKISVNANGQSFNISYKDLDASINYDELEEKIITFGKNQGFFTKLNLIKNPENRAYEFEILFNDENLTSFVSIISDSVDVSPTNASVNISGGSINISSDSTGLKLNSSELLDTIKNKIKDMNTPEVIEVTGDVEVVEADITSSSLGNVNKKISSYTTNYKSGASGTNLQIAAKNIDNTIVMPGETFSTEKAIGPTTLANGFVEANTYVAGKVVPGVGGGVCQVASTLYNTMLRAGIIPTERLNHMMKVSYVPIGLDATLADNLIDLKFVNEFDYPIVINSYASNGSLTIEFWCNDSVTNGITYEPVSVPLSDLSADTYLYGYDSNGELVVNKYLDRSTYQPLPN
ncbi:VanW family protein [Clostridium nigeriense]|uniref:VanW family protein n=1 Tax=Clostridium nigeriense TaxID=1805470 RepID=UPI003D327B8A